MLGRAAPLAARGDRGNRGKQASDGEDDAARQGSVVAEATSTLRSEDERGWGFPGRVVQVTPRGVTELCKEVSARLPCPILVSSLETREVRSGIWKNVKFRANSESFAEYGHQLCKHVAGRGNTFIPNFPSAVSLEKGNQLAVANVAVYNATLNITAALGINTLTLSFPSLASCTPTKNSLTMVFSDGY